MVSKLLDLQKNGEFRVAIHGYDSMKDELVICQRIVRRENFMVAFFNLNMLDLTIPVPRKTWLVGGGFRRTQTKLYKLSYERLDGSNGASSRIAAVDRFNKNLINVLL